MIRLKTCPFPNCPEPFQEEITNNHSMKFHGMTRMELFEKYGRPKMTDFDSRKINGVDKERLHSWISAPSTSSPLPQGNSTRRQYRKRT